MGKKGSSKKIPNAISGSQSITLREESTKKRHTNVNIKSMLKLEHLKNLALWAGGEAFIPSLGAFYGHRLAASAEVFGAPPDPSLFTCQRCESILQPGYNCTIRIEKNRMKVRSRRKKSTPGPQNNMVYKCHFCSHRNLMRGTPKGRMKEICPPKAKAPPKRGPIKATDLTSDSSMGHNMDKVESITMDDIASFENFKDDSITKSPATPLLTPTLSLLEAKMKKRNRSSAKKGGESASSSVNVDAEKSVTRSNKRRRKSWISLKEIAEGGGNDGGRKFPDLTIPFLV